MIRNLFRNNPQTESDPADQITGGLTTNRLEAFSDGVFAIAITILVLSIEVPRLSEVSSAQDLLNKVSELWPKLLSYILSFVVVGTYWVAHSATFHYIERTNRLLFWLNLAYLLCVSFIPFPTALLGTFYQYQLAIVIYAATQALTGLLFQLMVWYATSSGLSRANLERDFLRRAAFRNLTGPVIYLVAIIVSFVSLPISLLLMAVVPILYILPGKIDHDWRLVSLTQGTYPPDGLSETTNIVTPAAQTNLTLEDTAQNNKEK